jgi:hypothetical protein
LGYHPDYAKRKRHKIGPTKNDVMKYKILLLFIVLGINTALAQENKFYERLKEKAVDKAIDIGLDYAEQLIRDAINSSMYNNQNTTYSHTSSTFTKKFRGAVNDKYYFHLTLYRNGDNLSGVLYYDKYNKNMKVAGVIDSNDNLVFYEYFEGKLTAIYTGYIKNGKINGVFTSGDNKRVYTYYLDEYY